jgi:hypothetical protein
VQHLDTATVTDRHHTAVRAPGQRLVELHIEHQQAIVAGGHLEDMEAVNTEDLISPRTPGGASAHVECNLSLVTMRSASGSPSARGLGKPVGVQPQRGQHGQVGVDRVGLALALAPLWVGCSHSITTRPAAVSARDSPTP